MAPLVDIVIGHWWKVEVIQNPETTQPRGIPLLQGGNYITPLVYLKGLFSGCLTKRLHWICDSGCCEELPHPYYCILCRWAIWASMSAGCEVGNSTGWAFFLLKRAIPGALRPPKRECCEGELLDCIVAYFSLMVTSTVFFVLSLNHSFLWEKTSARNSGFC